MKKIKNSLNAKGSPQHDITVHYPYCYFERTVYSIKPVTPHTHTHTHTHTHSIIIKN